jgi:hypothetical protein
METMFVHPLSPGSPNCPTVQIIQVIQKLIDYVELVQNILIYALVDHVYTIATNPYDCRLEELQTRAYESM